MIRAMSLVPVVIMALALAIACEEPATQVQPATPLPAAPAPDSGASGVGAALATPEPAAPALPAATPQAAPTTAPLATPATGAAGRKPTPAPIPTPIQARFPVTVIDANGREITFEEPPERIVVMDSAVVETLFALGEGHRVVATHDFVTHPAGAADVPRVGGAFDMNLEATVALEPDLVFVFYDAFVEKLENAGLKVFYQETLGEDFIKVADNIRMWGRIIGNPAPAEELATAFESRIGQVAGALDSYSGGPSILMDVGGFWAPGSGTLIGEVFDLLKLQNIAADVSGYAQLSPELIVERNPHIILTADPSAFTDNPAFKDVAALKNGQVIQIHYDFLSIAGPRYAEWIEELAGMIYAPLLAQSQ